MKILEFIKTNIPCSQEDTRVSIVEELSSHIDELKTVPTQLVRDRDNILESLFEEAMGYFQGITPSCPMFKENIPPHLLEDAN
jgi:hypothetical protein